MKINIHAKNMKPHGTLEDFVNEKLQILLKKYESLAPTFDVYFEHIKNSEQIEVKIKTLTKGHELFAHDSDTNAEDAFAQAESAIDAQLNKLHSKMSDHR